MKKRAMKKWIPKSTHYCYKVKHIKGKSIIVPCKWWRLNTKKDTQENGYCIYLNKGDWQDDNLSLLWDQCKECNLNKKVKNNNPRQIIIDGVSVTIIDY